MYKVLTIAQEDEMLVLQTENDISSQIFWVLTTPNNKVPIENLAVCKDEEGIYEFKYFFANKKQIDRITNEMYELEVNSPDIELGFKNFQQFTRCLLEKKSLSEILKENH